MRGFSVNVILRSGWSLGCVRIYRFRSRRQLFLPAAVRALHVGAVHPATRKSEGCHVHVRRRGRP